MKLLLDQGLPLSAAALLRDAGIDTIHVGEIGMSKAEDAEIIGKSRDEGRIIATLDADFHTLLALKDLGVQSAKYKDIYTGIDSKLTKLITETVVMEEPALPNRVCLTDSEMPTYQAS
jgi:hypothetical protein